MTVALALLLALGVIGFALMITGAIAVVMLDGESDDRSGGAR